MTSKINTTLKNEDDHIIDDDYKNGDNLKKKMTS